MIFLISGKHACSVTFKPFFFQNIATLTIAYKCIYKKYNKIKIYLI